LSAFSLKAFTASGTVSREECRRTPAGQSIR
jgi:hypothetical protein